MGAHVRSTGWWHALARRLAGHAGVRQKIERQIGLHVVFLQEPEIAMRPAMSAHLKQGIGQKLLGSLAMIEEPFAAREEGGLHIRPAAACRRSQSRSLRFLLRSRRDRMSGRRASLRAAASRRVSNRAWPPGGGKGDGVAFRLDRSIIGNVANCLFVRPFRPVPQATSIAGASG